MPESMQVAGKYLVITGAIIVLVGLVLMVVPRVPFLGKLPGDIHIRRDNLEIFIPLTTSLLLSLLVSLGIWVYRYFTKE